jgi:hypothetical protein
MTFDENNPQPPAEDDNTPAEPAETVGEVNNGPVAEDSAHPVAADTAPQPAPEADRMNQRLERLGGEPAPVITPEEFARLQKAGQVHIDARGRVRTERPRGVDPGVSLRKRRAWYAAKSQQTC